MHIYLLAGDYFQACGSQTDIVPIIYYILRVLANIK